MIRGFRCVDCGGNAICTFRIDEVMVESKTLVRQVESAYCSGIFANSFLSRGLLTMIQRRVAEHCDPILANSETIFLCSNF